MKKDPFDFVGDYVYDEPRRDEKFSTIQVGRARVLEIYTIHSSKLEVKIKKLYLPSFLLLLQKFYYPNFTKNPMPFSLPKISDHRCAMRQALHGATRRLAEAPDPVPQRHLRGPVRHVTAVRDTSGEACAARGGARLQADRAGLPENTQHPPV